MTSYVTAAVRFPDGTVRWGRYDGTSDWLEPWLYDTPDQAWEAGRDDYDELPEGDVVDVEVWNAYGAGTTWRATAAINVIVSYLGFVQVDGWTPGRPSWVDQALLSAS